MHFPRILAVFSVAVGHIGAVAQSNSSSAADVFAGLQAKALASLQTNAMTGGCSISDAVVRRDWAALSSAEKKSYISAVQCLLDLPSKSNPSFAPGARNRYDDFAAVHINQTLTIHGTGNFLTWHRYFTWSYEQTLRNECSYDGYQPYWNWFAEGGDLTKSPILDGSETSMSGDGAYVYHNGSNPTATIHVPSGNGGGCITDGPFVNMTAHLGPVAPAMDGMTAAPNGSLSYNPRCLRRDLTAYTSTTWWTAANLLNVTLGAAAENISTFQNELQGRFGDGFLGMHATGHISVSGDASDVFSSIVDPTFLLHHAMIDHVYWIWQALHPAEAAMIAGTITILNTPPSRDALLNDTVYLSSVLAPDRTIEELLSTTGDSPLCYIYL